MGSVKSLKCQNLMKNLKFADLKISKSVCRKLQKSFQELMHCVQSNSHITQAHF